MRIRKSGLRSYPLHIWLCILRCMWMYTSVCTCSGALNVKLLFSSLVLVKLTSHDSNDINSVRPNVCQQNTSEGFDSCHRPSNLKLDSNRQFFRPCDHEIWWMTSKNNRALVPYYVKLCASFQIHWWIQTGFTVQKRSIRVEIGDMLSRVTLKFNGWPWKTIGHLFYATSSFV